MKTSKKFSKAVSIFIISTFILFQVPGQALAVMPENTSPVEDQRAETSVADAQNLNSASQGAELPQTDHPLSTAESSTDVKPTVLRIETFGPNKRVHIVRNQAGKELVALKDLKSGKVERYFIDSYTISRAKPQELAAMNSYLKMTFDLTGGGTLKLTQFKNSSGLRTTQFVKLGPGGASDMRFIKYHQNGKKAKAALRNVENINGEKIETVGIKTFTRAGKLYTDYSLMRAGEGETSSIRSLRMTKSDSTYLKFKPNGKNWLAEFTLKGNPVIRKSIATDITLQDGGRWAAIPETITFEQGNGAIRQVQGRQAATIQMKTLRMSNSQPSVPEPEPENPVEPDPPIEPDEPVEPPQPREPEQPVDPEPPVAVELPEEFEFKPVSFTIAINKKRVPFQVIVKRPKPNSQTMTATIRGPVGVAETFAGVLGVQGPETLHSSNIVHKKADGKIDTREFDQTKALKLYFADRIVEIQIKTDYNYKSAYRDDNENHFYDARMYRNGEERPYHEHTLNWYGNNSSSASGVHLQRESYNRIFENSVRIGYERFRTWRNGWITKIHYYDSRRADRKRAEGLPVNYARDLDEYYFIEVSRLKPSIKRNELTSLVADYHATGLRMRGIPRGRLRFTRDGIKILSRFE